MVRKYAVTEDEFLSMRVDPVDGHLKATRDNGTLVDFGKVSGDITPEALAARDAAVAAAAAAQAVGNTNDTIMAAVANDDQSAFAKKLAEKIIAQVGAAEQAIVGLGDSMMWGQTAPGTQDDWVSGVGTDLGVPAVNLGKPGWASTDIALLAGAVDVSLAVTGGSIAASGWTTVTVSTPGSYRSSSSTQLVWTGVLVTAGGARIAGQLEHVQGGSHYWRFQPSGLSAPVSAASGVFHCTAADAYTGRCAVIWAGRNNTATEMQYAVRDTTSIVKRWEDRGGRAILLTVTNATGETVNTTMHTAIAGANHLIRQRNQAVFDVRRWLIDQAMSELALTPTADDIADAASDVPPRQLRSDTTHLTSPAYQGVRANVVALIRKVGAIASSALVTVKRTSRALPFSGVLADFSPAGITDVPDAALQLWANPGRPVPALTRQSGTSAGRVVGVEKAYMQTLNLTPPTSYRSSYTPPALTAATVGVALRWGGYPSVATRIAGLTGTSSSGCSIGATSTGQVTLFTGAGATLTTTDPVPLGWHTVVGVIDGTTGYLWVDGVLSATGAVGAIPAPAAGFTGVFGVPGMDIACARFAVIDHALTDAEAATFSDILRGSIPA